MSSTPTAKTSTSKKPSTPRSRSGGASKSKSDVTSVHAVTAGEPITYETSGHPPRKDSATYTKSRATLKKIVGTLSDWYFNRDQAPYQDHHGGGLWLYDDKGWFFVRNLVGIEWSGQFCADPKKIDALRTNAARVYAGFPKSFDAFKKLGIDLQALLDKEITDTDGIAVWTDSICNASVPLPQSLHTGALPKGSGVHEYPTPVTDIERFKHDDFQLWVTDDEGKPAAVVPRAPLSEGNQGVRVLHATHGSKLHKAVRRVEKKGEHHEVEAHHDLAKKAFAKLTKKTKKNS